MSIGCLIGFHKWNYSRKLNIYDIFPSPFDSKYLSPTRKCIKCNKEEKWLSGCGGSEAGCWL